MLKITNEQLLQMTVLKEKLISPKMDNFDDYQFSFTEEYSTTTTQITLLRELDELKNIVQFKNQIFPPLQPKNNSKIVPLFTSAVTAFLLSVFLVLLFFDKTKNEKQ